MYLLDSNAFMEASRLYYAFDLAPAFWAWLGSSDLEGQVASIQAIKDEITAGSGELVGWARARPDRFWLQDTDKVVAAMRDVAAWATDPGRQYRSEAIDDFLGSADFQLVAYAKAVRATVVTRQRPAPESKKKVKIPDVCNAFSVVWIDPFALYRTLGLRLG